MMRVLALSGSLRARSINTEVLHAATLLAGSTMHVTMYHGLVTLPHFNPDLDEIGMVPPAPVVVLRAAVASADALLVSCPEYAHGVAGAFKNLLDWLVSGPEVVGKPVCVLRASTSSRFGPQSLVETLRTMSAVIVTDDVVTIPVNGRRLDAAAIVADETLAAALRAALAATRARCAVHDR